MPRSKKHPKPPPRDPENPSPQYGRTYAKETYSLDEIRAILEATSGKSPSAVRNYALITVLWQGGLRISEALDLRVVDFDLDAARILVRHGKGNKSRRVVIGPDAVTATRRWIAKRASLDIGSDSMLFCTLAGGQMRDTYVRDMLKRLAKRAGIEKRVHAHGFRHTHAVTLAKQGMPVPFIQRQLGHESLEVTSVYLSALTTHDVEEAMEKIDWTGKET